MNHTITVDTDEPVVVVHAEELTLTAELLDHIARWLDTAPPAVLADLASWWILTHAPRSTSAREILFDNAADLYGFERNVLQPHVDRVGFEVGDLLATGTT